MSSHSSPKESDELLLKVNNLKMHFPITRGLLRRTVGYVKAVDDVAFNIFQGETLGIVGESGCGKTTLARCLLQIYQPTSGEVLYYTEDGKEVNLIELEEEELKTYWKKIRMIFQDPYSSINPRFPIMDIIAEPLRINTNQKEKENEARVKYLLEKVGLHPEYLLRYPHALSGGERQRIGIARALALNPRLVFADEPVSALDVSVRAQIINLLNELQQELNLTFVFIAHDLSVIEYVSDRVGVMYVGKLVEMTDNRKLFNQPQHPYTEALLASIPRPDPKVRNQGNRYRLEGEVAEPSDPPKGCHFHTRCRYMSDVCKNEEPQFKEVGPNHYVACHFAEELNLSGVSEYMIKS